MLFLAISSVHWLVGVVFLQGAAKDGEDDTLELRFEYNDSGTWQWIIFYTKQVSYQSFEERIRVKCNLTAIGDLQKQVVHLYQSAAAMLSSRLA